ncbi:MAG: Ig-like domain-containing protein [bacterium]|nr:Ig-like domain-containing protein [bacterium]
MSTRRVASLRSCLVPLLVGAAILSSCSKNSTQSNPPPLPVVAGTYPSSGAVLSDSLTGPITITFTEAMKPASFTATTFWVDGKPGTVSYANGIAAFKPTTPFAHNESYTAHVAGSVSSQAGVQLGTAYSWSFTTRDWTLMPVVVKFDSAAAEEAGAWAVTPCTDGKYGIAGWTGLSGNRSIYLAKVDSNGVALWQKTVAAGGYGQASSIVETQDHGFAIAGLGGDFGSAGLLIKTDATGNVQWQKSFQGVGLYGVTLAADGNLITWGGSVAKYSVSTGELLWTATTTGTVRGLCAGPAGSYLYTSEIPGDFDPAKSICGGRIDAAGNSVWFKMYFHGHYQEGYSARAMAASADGNYAVFGGWDPSQSRAGGVAAKINAAGDSLWTSRDEHGWFGGPITSGCRFRDGLVGFVPFQTDNHAMGPVVYFTNGGAWIDYRPETWTAPGIRQAFWVYSGIPRGSDELIAVGEMTLENDTAAKPRKKLFLRLRYM